MMLHPQSFSLNVFGARNSRVRFILRDCQSLLALRKSNSVLPVFGIFLSQILLSLQDLDHLSRQGTCIMRKFYLALVFVLAVALMLHRRHQAT